jgi:MarR family transcriptional regulator for hemolysin
MQSVSCFYRAGDGGCREALQNRQGSSSRNIIAKIRWYAIYWHINLFGDPMATREIIRRTFGPMLAQTARQWRRMVNARLQPYGLTEATWLPLVRVARAAKPMRQKDLAASLGLDGSSVVRLLDALEKASLLDRREEAGDRRAKVLVLTKRGRSIVDQVETVAREVRNRALADLPERDIETAFAVLEHICRVLDSAEEPVS